MAHFPWKGILGNTMESASLLFTTGNSINKNKKQTNKNTLSSSSIKCGKGKRNFLVCVWIGWVSGNACRTISLWCIIRYMLVLLQLPLSLSKLWNCTSSVAVSAYPREIRKAVHLRFPYAKTWKVKCNKSQINLTIATEGA